MEPTPVIAASYTRRTIVSVTAEGQQRRQEASGEATEVSPSSGKESRIASTPTPASPIASGSRAADYARRHPRTVALRSANHRRSTAASKQTNRQPKSAARRRTTTAALQSIHPRNEQKINRSSTAEQHFKCTPADGSRSSTPQFQLKFRVNLLSIDAMMKQHLKERQNQRPKSPEPTTRANSMHYLTTFGHLEFNKR
ncbi:uncharacterized protein LOC119767427 [Culex quinquefasciatus]|uniref:uncharacterized protein LOC119767427 n=1 Tax=Culex quinquefasciatus TaxID=7176 RepID=UPI0018E3ECB8|nr:uncharacterized protein LOC119767427 [Culex quinquefasciatus]